MLNSTVYVPGHGEGIIDAICDDTQDGTRKRTYFVIFNKGKAQWVEAARVTLTDGAIIKQAPVKSSFTEGE